MEAHMRASILKRHWRGGHVGKSKDEEGIEAGKPGKPSQAKPSKDKTPSMALK
jgi:hypothetical protein